MFKKLFSCFNDASDMQIDLSRQGQNEQNRPQLAPESNINGQNINFEMDDSNCQNLQHHFLQSASSNPKFRQQYIYEQEDGELESKLTTVPQSKTKHYEQEGDQDQNDTLKESYKQQKMQQRSGGQSHAMVMSMTEKKLNNYLQQAQYLIGTNVTDKNGKRVKHRLQNYSIDNNDLHDSSNSSKVLFNAAGGALATSSSNEKSDPLTETQMKQSFMSLKKGDDEKKIKKQQDYKTRSGQLKDKKQKMLTRIKTSDNDVFDKMSTTHRFSDQTKSTFIKTPQKQQEMSAKSLKNNKQKVTLQSNPSEFIIAEEVEEHQKYQKELVLEHDEGQQMDLGHLKPLNKRHSSKTEVGPPMGGTLSKHKKNQPSAAGVPQQPQSASKPKGVVSHKKTSSYFTHSDTTRNNTLHQRHLTATTSPVMERTQSEKGKRLSTEQKKKIEPRISNPSGRKIVASKTLEIKEDQNEDEDQDKKQDVHKQISPSSQSSFSFQPKFFKPTNMPLPNMGKHSVSMEDHLINSTLQTQHILQKTLSKKL